MLMPTLFSGDLVTRERPYNLLATIWTVFTNLRHNTSPAKDGGAASMPQAPSSHAPHTVTTSVTSITPLQRNNRRTGRPDASNSILNVSPVYSRRDPFSVDNGLWPFDDRDHASVCTVTNNMLNTDMSL